MRLHEILILILTIAPGHCYLTIKGDAKKKMIPEGFPKGVLLVREDYKEEPGEPKYTLHPDYRRKYKKAFIYFATKILPCVNARYTDYKSKCQTKNLSEVFTESDEADALALLINEYESYQFKLRKDKDEGDAKPRKPFTNNLSGNMLGWNLRGQETCAAILEEVRQRRKELFSKTLE
jgi:hypothetical protein